MRTLFTQHEAAVSTMSPALAVSGAMAGMTMTKMMSTRVEGQTLTQPTMAEMNKGGVGLLPERETPEIDRLEVEWIDRARGGDQAAFSRLMDKYRNRIVRLAYQMVGDVEEANDLAQETFVRVYKALGTFDSNRAFTPWLYRIANNVIYDHFRSRKARPKTIDLDPERPFDEGPDPDAVDPQMNVMADEIRGQVRKAIQSLPENYRSVIVSRYVDDLSYAEIAESLGLTEANVMMRMSRARQLLKKKLEYLQVNFPS